MSKVLDFGWGDPYCVREALKFYYQKKFTSINFDDLKYHLGDGNEDLIKLTRQFIQETTGEYYNYITITNGTTSALNIVLRVLAKSEKKHTCYTHKYYFPFYPHIIEKNNYKHEKGLYRDHQQQLSQEGVIGLVDSPSNPEGDLLAYGNISNNIIWDSVYHNPVFINGIGVKPDHRVNCGSYSKVLGLTGARIGWIATNSLEDHNLFTKENLHENCTLSHVNQNLIVDILNNIDLNNFLRAAKYRVNNNRELFEKIIYLFDNQQVPENGMFYSAWTSKHTVKVLDKLEIKYVTLDEEGGYKFLRFNLAHYNETTQKMIRFLLKEDLK